MDDVSIIEAGLLRSYERYQHRLLEMNVRPTLLGMPTPDDNDLTPLMDAFDNTQAFRAVNGWSIWAKGRQNALSARWLSEWAFPGRYSKIDLNELARKIHRVLTAREELIALNTAVWGAKIVDPIRIDENTILQRFSDLETSERAEFADNGRARPARLLGAYGAAVTGNPTLAICVHCRRFPFLSNDPAAQSRLAQEMVSQADLTCLSLVAFGTRSPIIDLSWFEYKDSILDTVWHEVNRYWRMPEVMPSYVVPVDVEVATLVKSHSCLLGLPEDRQTKVVSSARRFELSLARRNQGDQAIDLCTAFELILGSGGEGGISWSNGLRCAGLLGGQADDRRANRDIVQSLYKIRNNCVHGGDVSDKVKTKTMGKIGLAELIDKSRVLYSKLLQAMVALKSYPDWFEIETNGGVGTS